MEHNYFQLRAYLFPREQQRICGIKLEELANLWFCTTKQCKRRLKKYELEGFLTYQPGNGRGNQSTLSFRQSFQQEVESLVNQAIKLNNLEDIVFLLQLDIPKHWFDKGFTEIQSMFGIQPPTNNQVILRAIIRRKLTSLTPTHAAVSRESFIIKQLGDSLLNYDSSQHTLLPGIAHHWQVSGDTKHFTFFLRKSVQFHHGRTLTSQDVRFTLERACSADSIVKWQMKDIETIECPSDFIISIHLKKADPFFCRYLAMCSLVILPYDVSFNEKQWIATGPFKMKEYSDTKIILEAFDNYYGERALIDQIEFWTIDNLSLPNIMITSLEHEADTNYIETENPGVGVEFWIFNFHKQTIVQNRFFREAIYHLLDMKKADDMLGLDIGKVASRFSYHKSQLEKKDSTKIDGLLASANYQGETLILGVLDHPVMKKQALWIQKMAASHHIQLEVRFFALDKSFYTKDFEEQADMLLMGDIPPDDPELGFLDFCYNPSLLCQRFFSPSILEELHAKLEKMKIASDFLEREREIDKIDTWLVDNHFLIYTFHPTKRERIHSMIDRKDSKYHYGHFDLRTVWADGGPVK